MNEWREIRKKGSDPNGTNLSQPLSGNALASGLVWWIGADRPAASADPLTKFVPFGSDPNRTNLSQLVSGNALASGVVL